MSSIRSKAILRRSNVLQISLRFNRRALIACLIALMIHISVFVEAACPATASDSTAITYLEDKFDSYSQSNIMKIVAGPVSKNLYIKYRLYIGSYNNQAIKKLDTSDNKVWETGYDVSSTGLSFSIDSNEQNIYLESNQADLSVIRISASDGSIVNQVTFNGISSIQNSFVVFPYKDNTGFYVTGYIPASANIGQLCRYTFSTSIGECQTTTNIQYTVNILMISQTQFVLLGYDTTTRNFHIYKFSFSATSVDWANKIVCSFGSCAIGYSEMLLSPDSSTFYSFFTYGALKYLYYTEFSASTGSVIGTRYKSSSSISSVYGLAQSGDYFVAVTSSANLLVLYKISTSEFTIKRFSTVIFYGCAVELSSGRFIVFGIKSLNSFMLRFIPQAMNDVTILAASTTTMNALSAGTDDIVTDTEITLTAAATSTTSTPTFATKSVTYNLISYTKSDVYYQLADQSISVIESSTSSHTPDVPCSSSGSTAITYTTADFGSTTIPSWVSINSDTGALSITSPTVNADTEHNFYINSAITGSSGLYQKKVKLIVMNCGVSNCQTCTTSSGSTCQTCQTGYVLTSGACMAPESSASDEAKALGIFILCMIIVSLFVVAVFSCKNSTSMWSFWSIVGQMQMLILVFLSRSVTSEDVRKLLSTSNFTLNIYHYIYIPRIKFYDLAFSSVKFELTTSSLNDVLLDSDSWVYNLYPVMTCVFVIALLHLGMLFLGKQIMKINSNGKCRGFIKIVKWTLWKLYRIMTFGFYIRNAFLMCEFILICTIYEIFKNNGYGSYRVISLIFAYLVVLLYVAFTIFVCYLAVSSNNEEHQSHSMLNEFFWGLKRNKIYRLYMAAFIIRRAFYTLFFVGLTSLSSEAVVGIITGFQFYYLIYIIVIRPFEEVVVNAIEILNEATLFLLIFILNFFPQNNNWTKDQNNVYMAFIVINFILTFLIVSINGTYTFINWYRKKPSRADLYSEDGPNFIPNNEFESETSNKGNVETNLPIQANAYNADENQLAEESKMYPVNKMF